MYKAKYLQPRPRTGSDTILHLKPRAGLTSAAKLFDYSLNGHIGTVTGTSPTFKYPGIDLPGTNEHIVVADHSDFTPILTPFSIRTWVYMHAGDFHIATKGVFNTDAEWRFFTDASKKPYFQALDESVDSCYIGRFYNTSLSLNQWIHLVATYDGGILNSGINLYANGVLVDDNDSEGNPASFEGIVASGHDVWVGQYDSAYANGLVGELMIDEKELSAVDIRSDYEVTRSRYGV